MGIFSQTFLVRSKLIPSNGLFSDNSSVCCFLNRTSKKYKSMNDLLALAKESDKSGLSFSAMKSLVLREKEDKTGSENFGNEETFSLIQALFDAGEYLLICLLEHCLGYIFVSCTVH